MSGRVWTGRTSLYEGSFLVGTEIRDSPRSFHKAQRLFALYEAAAGRAKQSHNHSKYVSSISRQSLKGAHLYSQSVLIASMSAYA